MSTIHTPGEFLVIKNPIEIQATILVYLRALFRADVVNGLHWDEEKSKRTIDIEVADKTNQDVLNLKPAIFLSIGSIGFQSLSATSDTLDYKIRAVVTEENITKKVSTGRTTMLLVSFPVGLNIYSSKEECSILSYKVAKLMMAFRQSLEKFSNIYSISDFRLSPPEYMNGFDKETYKAQITFNAQFYDLSTIFDVSKLIKQAYLVGTSTSANGSIDYEIDHWTAGTQTEEEQ